MVDAFLENLNYTCQNKQLFIDALTHPSANRHNKRFERLEFLGDRVLGVVIAAELLRRFPAETEGDLAKRHAALVSRETCQKVAELMHLRSSVKAVCDREAAYENNVLSILADAVEAVLGAMFIDSGLVSCETVIKQYWEPFFDSTKAPPKDAKSALQEWAQRRKKGLPVYAVIDSQGPSHLPHFTCQVTVLDIGPFYGEGPNRRAAEQSAAENALKAFHPERTL